MTFSNTNRFALRLYNHLQVSKIYIIFIVFIWSQVKVMDFLMYYFFL